MVPDKTESHLGTDHLTCRGGGGGGGGGVWFFVSFRIFFRTTPELEYFFFVAQSANFFFQNSTLGYDKNSESDYFFPSTKIRIFFSATLGIRIFFFH